MVPHIRTARVADAPAIARVHVESWRATYGGLLPERYLDGMSARNLTSRWQTRLSRPDPDEWTFVASVGGEVVGFVLAGSCEDDSLLGFAGEMQMLYVSPRFLRQGIGASLFSRAVEALEEYPYYWLVVWVVEKNEVARAFYGQVGMARDGGRRVDRFVGSPIKVVRYAMPLNPAMDYDHLRGQLAGEPAK